MPYEDWKTQLKQYTLAGNIAESAELLRHKMQKQGRRGFHSGKGNDS